MSNVTLINPSEEYKLMLWYFNLVCGARQLYMSKVKLRCSSKIEEMKSSRCGLVWKHWMNGWFNLNCVFNAPSKPRLSTRSSVFVSLSSSGELSLSHHLLFLTLLTLDFFLFHFLASLAFCFALTLLWTSVSRCLFSLSLSQMNLLFSVQYIYISDVRIIRNNLYIQWFFSRG